MIDLTKLRSHINYTPKEIKIRNTHEYADLKNTLEAKVQVNKYKNDPLDVDLTSNFGEEKVRQIKEPICVEGCQEQIFDLYDVFFYKEKATCKFCKKQATKKNIKKEQYYSHIIQQMSDKSFSCSIIGEYCFHSFSEDIQPKAREMLKKNEFKNLFNKMITNSKSKKGSLKQTILDQIRQTQQEHNQHDNVHINRILEFPFQCLINCQKIIIPVYLEQCKHLECYEFTNILRLIDDNQKLPNNLRRQSVKCFNQDCNTQISLDINQLQEQLIFPFEIASAISKEYPFSLKLTWDFRKSEFQHQRIKVNQFLRNDDKQIVNDYTFLIQVKKLINSEIPIQLQNKLNFSKYKVNLFNIQFPCRCHFCELQNVKDIQIFIFTYINRQQGNLYTCPACNYVHENPQNLFKIVYFDRYLYRALVNEQELQQFEYNKQDTKLFKFFLKQQQVDFKQIKKIYQQNQIYPYSNLQCILSNKKIKEPLTLIYCQKKRTVEFKQLKKFLVKNNFSFTNFPKCNCLYCSKVSLDLTDFYYDVVFKQILLKNTDQAEQEYLKNQIIQIYLNNNNQIEEIPQIEKISKSYQELFQQSKLQQQEKEQYQKQREQLQHKQEIQKYQQQLQQQEQLINNYQMQIQNSQYPQQQQYQQQQFYQQQQPQFQNQFHQQNYQQNNFIYQPQQQGLAKQNSGYFDGNYDNNQNQQNEPQYIYENGNLIPIQIYKMRNQ